MLEVGQQHIFSGWKGTCRSGMKWDFSYLSDPMTIVSYAMQAYATYDWATSSATATTNTGGSEGGTGGATSGGTSGAGSGASSGAGSAGSGASTTTDSIWTKMKNQYNEWSKSVNESFNSAYDSVKETFKPITDGYDSAMNTIENTMTDITNKVTDTVDGISDSISSSIKVPDSVVDLQNSMSENLTNLTNKATDMANSAYDAVIKPIADPIQNGYNAAKDTVLTTIKDATNIEWDKSVEILGFKSITEGDLVIFAAKSAYIIAAPPQEQDYILADRLLRGYSGITLGDDSTQAYNACMASIGLSLPNLIAWSMNEDGQTSSELKRPWENPIRLTPVQMGTILNLTSKEYVKSHYMIKSEDDLLLNVIAISGDAYMKAGEIVCAGPKVYQAMNHIRSVQQTKATSSSTGGSGSGADIAQAIGMAALSMVCPPCGFAATIVMDLVTNVFAKVDTCNNEEDAMQWDLNDYKTNKFTKQDQCHLAKTYCDKAVSFFGSKKCVRTANDHCCYDQITTRIFAEGIKEQLGKGWGSCNDITIYDLKNISFRECRPGEIPRINKCFPISSYEEFQQAMFRQANKNLGMGSAKKLTEQVIQSMGIE